MKKNILYFLACSFALQGCGESAEQRTLEYLQSGKTYYAQKEYSKAKVELRNALQIDGDLADAYYHLALIDEQDQNWKGMYANVNQAIRLDSENHGARLMLAKLFLLTGEIESARDEIDLVLDKAVNNLDAIALKGAVFLKQGDKVAALAEAEKALAINPAHQESIGLQVVVYSSKLDYVAAEKVIKRALQVTPDELSLYVLKLQMHLNSKNKLAIEQDYQELIERFPDKHEFIYALAKYYVSEQRDNEALVLLQKVVEQNADLLEPKLALIDHLAEKQESQAVIMLNKLTQGIPRETALYFRLANLQLKQKKFEQAKKTLKKIIDFKGVEKEGLVARTLLAKVAILEKDISTASAVIEEVLAVDARHYEGLILNVRIKLTKGLSDEVIGDLRGMLRDYPQSDEAMVLLAQAYLKKESPELAEENFRKALELNPGNFSAVLPVVSRMVRSKDIARADKILQEALKISPDHAGALQVLAQVRLLSEDWEGTQQVADLILTKPKGEGFSYYIGGKISQGQGLYADAIKKYQQALEVSPDLFDALKSMMVCYEKRRQSDKMYAYLDKFILSNPDNPYPLQLKGELYSANKRWKKALAVLKKGIDKWPKEPQFYVLMANVYHEMNNPQKVFDSYKKGLKNSSDNVQLSILLSSAYEQDKKYDDALAVYESLLAQRPGIDLAVNNLVSLLLDHFSGKENTARAVKLAKSFEKSEQPYFLDTYGWALLHNDSVKEAVMVFKQVIVKAPEVAVFKYHLGAALHKAGDNSQAVEVLKQALVTGAKQDRFIEQNQVKLLLNKLKAMKGEVTKAI